VNSPASEELHRELARLVDLEAFGAFSAYTTLIQSFHYDNTHNWRMFYDPWRTRMLPVVWDPNGWATMWLPAEGEEPRYEISTSIFHQLLFENADFLRARYSSLKQFFESGEDQRFLDFATEVTKQAVIAAENDAYLSPKYRTTVKRQTRDSLKTISYIFEQVKQAFLFDKSNRLTYRDLPGGKLALEVTSRAVIDQLILQYDQPVKNVGIVKLRYWVKGEKVEKDISSLVTVNRNEVVLSVPLLSEFYSGRDETLPYIMRDVLEVVPSYYELEVGGMKGKAPVLVSYAWGLDQLDVAQEDASIKPGTFRNLYGVIPEPPVDEVEVWKGRINISGVRVVDTPVIIRPGTRIQMQPGANVIFREKVLSLGEEGNPVVFTSPDIEGEPWGTVALKGRGTDDSFLTHTHFIHGSGYKDHLFEYSSMFSVHDTMGVIVDNCFFKDSKVVDDMVHVVYADVEIRNSTFENSLSDALDVDISSARLIDNIFINSGNDAIDLMTSTAVVTGTEITGSLDKAISVGEGSTLLALDNYFANNNIGVQSKDGSMAMIYNTDFVSNNIAIDAYKKNWRYDSGGDLFLSKSILRENKEGITADKHSGILVFDTGVDDLGSVQDKQVTLLKAVDKGKDRKARISRKLKNNKVEGLMQKFQARMDGLDKPFWKQVSLTTRGREQ
jgi:hypothetical protein